MFFNKLNFISKAIFLESLALFVFWIMEFFWKTTANLLCVCFFEDFLKRWVYCDLGLSYLCVTIYIYLGVLHVRSYLSAIIRGVLNLLSRHHLWSFKPWRYNHRPLLVLPFLISFRHDRHLIRFWCSILLFTWLHERRSSVPSARVWVAPRCLYALPHHRYSGLKRLTLQTEFLKLSTTFAFFLHNK
jgi:hypothetical protein